MKGKKRGATSERKAKKVEKSQNIRQFSKRQQEGEEWKKKKKKKWRGVVGVGEDFAPKKEPHVTIEHSTQVHQRVKHGENEIKPKKCKKKVGQGGHVSGEVQPLTTWAGMMRL